MSAAEIRGMTDAQLYAIACDLGHPMRSAANEELDARQGEDWSRVTPAGGAA